MILFVDKSLLLILGVLLKIYLFLKNFMIIFVCHFKCFLFLSLNMSSTFRLLELNIFFS